MDDEPSVILDPGSGSIKFGVSYVDKECDQKIYQNMSIPALYGKSRYPSTLFRKRPSIKGKYRRDYVIGKHALMLFDLLDITFPVNRGVVANWDIVLTILKDGLETFQSDAYDNPTSILVTEPWFHPRKKRENMVEIIFEKYEYKNFFSVPQTVLTLFNYNQKSGYVIESGYGQTQFSPIFDGHKVQNGCLNFNKGGFDVTVEIPKNNVDSRHFQLNYVEKKDENEEAKTKEGNENLKKTKERSENEGAKRILNPYHHFYHLENLKKKPPPNFDIDSIFNQIFFDGENSFAKKVCKNFPLIKGKEDLANNCQPLLSQIPKELYLGGGNFACKYFREKIENDFKKIENDFKKIEKKDYSDYLHFHILPDDEFEWSAWKGGNKFVNSPLMKDFWIPITDYYENGNNVINFSCL